MNIKYAIFDLDGTLFNSTHIWEKVDILFFESYGMSLPSGYLDVVAHKSLDEASLYTKHTYNLKESTHEIKAHWDKLIRKEYEENIALKPYVTDFLEHLKNKNVKMAVATGLPHSLFKPALKRLDIEKYFSTMCSVDDVKKGKGSPDLFLYTAKNLGAKPEECVMFEDVLNAMKVAKSVGMTVCAVWDKASKNEEEISQTADYYIKSWAELLND